MPIVPAIVNELDALNNEDWITAFSEIVTEVAQIKALPLIVVSIVTAPDVAIKTSPVIGVVRFTSSVPK